MAFDYIEGHPIEYISPVMKIFFERLFYCPVIDFSNINVYNSNGKILEADSFAN